MFGFLGLVRDADTMFRPLPVHRFDSPGRRDSAWLPAVAALYERPRFAEDHPGSRGSELARAQTAMVAKALQQAWPELEVVVEIIKTRGDEQRTEPRDPRAGRKGLFTGEIERFLAGGGIDLAVHSAKDLPSDATPGLEVGGVLPRAAVGRRLISKLVAASGIARGCVVGTGMCPAQSNYAGAARICTRLSCGAMSLQIAQAGRDPWEAIVLARLNRTSRTRVMAARHSGWKPSFLGKCWTTSFSCRRRPGVIAMQVRRDDSKTKGFVEQ